MKFKIGRRSSVYQLFSKRDFTSINGAKIGKKWPKIEFFDFFENVSFFTVFVLRMSGMCSTTWKTWKKPKKFENLSILANFDQFYLHFMNFNHVLKKVGRQSSDDLFKISYFLNLHALGHPKSVTNFFFTGFGLNCPSAWCVEWLGWVRRG
jgi:hypothetical protein